MLVTWFEDLASEVGIWTAFINRHNEMYNKFPPFYDLNDYFDAEPNPQDVTFLIWYYLSMQKRDLSFIAPSSNLIDLLGNLIYEIFDEEWDEAPANQKMKDFLHIIDDEDIFYTIRYKIDWLVLNSYLFYFYGWENEDEKLSLIKDYTEKKGLEFHQVEGILFGVHDDNVHGTITEILAMKGKEWLAYVLGEGHPFHQPLLEMGEKIAGRFLYLKQDDENVVIKHIGSGQLINITKKSMDSKGLMPNKTVLNIGLVKWQNEWYFSGSFFTQDYDDTILLEETADPMVSGLFEDKKKRSFIHDQYEIFLEFNNQKLIKYFKDKQQFHIFMNEFLDFYNKKIIEKTGKDILSKRRPEYISSDSPDENDQDFLLFFNKDIGVEVVTGFCNAIADPGNPYFDSMENIGTIKSLYFSPVPGKDLILYLSKNNYLPDYKMSGNMSENLLKENLDFVLRFYKKESYHAKIQLSLV